MPNPRKDSNIARENRRCELMENGYTVFRFDLAPKFTRFDLSLGDAFRYLKKCTGFRVTFWRCPVRGLGVRLHSPPNPKQHDGGFTCTVLHFATQADEAEAKRELVLDVLLFGIDLFRGLPNKTFEEQTTILRNLLTAPVGSPPEEYLGLKAQLHPCFQKVIDTRQADLRRNLL
jgi:hypothetical protein